MPPTNCLKANTLFGFLACRISHFKATTIFVYPSNLLFRATWEPSDSVGDSVGGSACNSTGSTGTFDVAIGCS